jgi:hypothetical protein
MCVQAGAHAGTDGVLLHSLRYAPTVTADIFKFSSTPSNNGGIVKSGLHWGENSIRPYPVGDTTTSGEAARMVVSKMLGFDKQGAKTMLNCTTGSAYRPCALIQDGDQMTMVLVNDGVVTATSGASKPQGLMVGLSLKTLLSADLQAGSIGACASVRRIHCMHVCAAWRI